MADPTAEVPASPEAVDAPPATETAPNSSEMAQALKAEVSIRDLLEAGAHFGHQTRRWNPRMKQFLFGERNGVHIIDLDQSLPRFREGLEFVTDVVSRGGKVLFVATKRQAQEPVRIAAERSNQYFVNNRWLGGMLTNFKTVKKSIESFKSMLEILGDEEKMSELSKKELARISRQVDKYRKSLDGIREMSRLPAAIFVIDVNCESIAVSEARRLGIPILAIVDSNCSPVDIDFVVPGNDDSIRAIQLYCDLVANACLQGEALNNARLQAQEAEIEKTRPAAKAETTLPGTGRVVVEIKHPPRRGRGAALAAERREAERSSTEAAEPEVPATPAPATPAAEVPESTDSGSDA